MEKLFTIEANLVDIRQRQIYPAQVIIDSGIITKIIRISKAENYLLPGFIDAHIHIESSMLVPSEFARLASRYGTVATISDPHEIANVLGVPGINYMIENGTKVPFNFYFGAPSCVPATTFESAGATIDAEEITSLLEREEIKYLAEMMNWPGVLHEDAQVMAKIDAAKKLNKPVDGHAPGLTGEQAIAYIKAGISTDHECVSYDEALHKINNGMMIAIREGSAARNYEALHPLISLHPDKLMFCSDDKHPDELMLGHINQLVVRSLNHGYDLFDVLQIACLNPIGHYGLDVGSLNVDDPADFIIVEDLKEFQVLDTYIKGEHVAHKGKTKIQKIAFSIPNKFAIANISHEELEIKADGKNLRVIEAVDGELITHETTEPATIENGFVISDAEKDVLKLVVVNRYTQVKPAIAFIKNFGLQSGAIASSVGHDSHNITAVGVDDADIARAVNLIIEQKGGVSATGFGEDHLLPLPVAGLMSDQGGEYVAGRYTVLDEFAKKLGSTLRAPFMTLSFMALLVIPDLKLSDKGLFSGSKFEFVDLFVD